GVVSVEDLVEQLVGEISDEHDIDEEPATAHGMPDLTVPGDERTLLVDGVLREDELAELTGFHVPAGPYETRAGFLMAGLGRRAGARLPRDPPAGAAEPPGRAGAGARGRRLRARRRRRDGAQEPDAGLAGARGAVARAADVCLLHRHQAAPRRHEVGLAHDPV